MSQLKYSWSEHSRFYRPSGGSWMGLYAPNPVPTYHLPTFQRAPWNSDLVRDEATRRHGAPRQDSAKQPSIASTRHKETTRSSGAWSTLGSFLPGGGKRAKKLDKPSFPVIPQDRQRSYGGFSHPVVSGVPGRDPTVRSSSSATVKPRTSLRQTDDSRHTGNRPEGVEHATLHPRPHVWPWQPSSASQLIRLNPYLQHSYNGQHPITFDIARGQNEVMHTRHGRTSTPLDLVHLRKQPATYPSVTHMRIQPVAEDPLPQFPWPIELVNPHGITCGDVLDAITRKFVERVSEREYNRWSDRRKVMAARAYHQRVRTPVDPGRWHEAPNVRDGLRRIDYVGGKVIFHGLEQASVMLEDTWFMYFGDGLEGTM